MRRVNLPVWKTVREMQIEKILLYLTDSKQRNRARKDCGTR